MSLNFLDAFYILFYSPLSLLSLLITFLLGYGCGIFTSKAGTNFLRFRSEEREKQRQRERQEQLEAEAEAAATAEAAKKKAIVAIREKFVRSPSGWMLVSKDKSDPRKYCMRCCEHRRILSVLDEVSPRRFYCPSCGWRSWPKRYTANGIE